jgi:hypothetical protein
MSWAGLGSSSRLGRGSQARPGRHPASPQRRLDSLVAPPAGPGLSPPAGLALPPGLRPTIRSGWACLPAGPVSWLGSLAASSAGPGLGPPAGPLPPTLLGCHFFPAPRLGFLHLRPGWAGLGESGLAGISPSGPLCKFRLGRIKYSGWATFCLLFRPGQAGIPWPRPDYPLSRPRFASSGIYSSPSIDSTAWCQSWDASRLGLAHPSSSYAGFGTLLGSNQHTPLF